jgi:uncharacterized membrane protein YuzA (DUF378 family)
MFISSAVQCDGLDRDVYIRRGWLQHLCPVIFQGRSEVKPLNTLALVLVIVGALNWGLVALFEFDLVAEIFGETFGTTNAVTRIVYGLVGVAGLYLAFTLLPAILRSDSRLAFGEQRRTHEAR